MPNLDTDLHLHMLRQSKRQKPARIARALADAFRINRIYGMEWGDPDTNPPLRYTRDQFILPFVKADQTALEIGPGGGRWTRYLMGFQRIYAVDYHPELLTELHRHFRNAKILVIQNNGTDFPGVPAHSVDYLLSMGVFVHLELPLIESYLIDMHQVLKPGANAVIQYSDKTKVMARLKEDFADNTPDEMRKLLDATGYEVLEEDLTTLWHSSMVRFRKS